MKHSRYTGNADLEHMYLFQREDEIYSEIKKERRIRIALLIIFFIVLALTAYAIIKKEYRNSIPPITVIDREQMTELQSYHGGEYRLIGDTEILIIKK